MNILDMTKEDFEKVSLRKNFMAPVPKFSSLVIIPTTQVYGVCCC